MATDDHQALVGEVRRLLASGEARKLRQAAGVTQQEAADSIGVGHGTLCRWEIGVRNPSTPAAIRYAELLASWGSGS